MTQRVRGSGIGAGFGQLWAASTMGNLGDGVARVAIALLAARLTRDPFAVAMVTALTYLPWLVLGLPAGVLVDRYDRRRLAVLVGSVRPAAVAVLAIAAATDHVSLWLLYAVVLLLYTCETVYDSAAIAIVPMVVANRADLERANGRLQGAALVADQFVGPPLASMVFALAAAYAFGLTAAAFALAAALLLTLPGSYRARRYATPPVERQPSMWTEMREAVRYMRRHALHRTLLALMMMVFGGAAMVNATMVLWAQEVLGVSEAMYGVLALAMAVGAVAGSQSAATLARRLGRGRSLWISAVAAGIGALFVAATTNPYAGGVVLAFTGWSGPVFNVVNVSVRQRLTPPALLGRVTGVYRAGTVSVMLVGSFAGGAVAALGGLRLPWLLFGAGALAAAALVTRRLRNDVVDEALTAADEDADREGDR